jgi:hypothetical protein
MADARRYEFQIRRDQIASFVKDPRTIRDIEALQRAVTQTTPQDIAELDEAKVNKTTQIIAGGGLTDGGDLSGDVTLNIGAGTGIIINADDVAIDTTAEAERIRDVIGATLTAGANISITVDDAGDHISIAVTGLTTYSDEQAQDAVGMILADTATIDFTYDDATPTITADVKPTPIRQLGVSSSSGATYTLSSSDIWKHVRFTSNSAITLTINTSHGFSAGDRVRFTAGGTGQVTMSPSSVTLNSRAGALKSAGQYSVWELECVGANEFDVLGDVTA